MAGVGKGKNGEAPEGSCRREAILDAASRLFAESGFAETDTQQLADALQVGKGTLYRHFPSKREMFLAAADRVMRRLQGHVDASLEGVEDPLEQVRRGIRAFLEFFGEHPEYVELIVQERAQFKDREKPTYLEHRERIVGRWRDLYRGLIAAGRVRPMPVEQITDVVASAIYGAMFLTYSSGRSGAFAAGADEIVDVILHGILSDDERRRRALNPNGPAAPPNEGKNR
jgi:AcrR family transcriptional regulator